MLYVELRCHIVRVMLAGMGGNATHFHPLQWALWPMWLANSKRQPCLYPP